MSWSGGRGRPPRLGWAPEWVGVFASMTLMEMSFVRGSRVTGWVTSSPREPRGLQSKSALKAKEVGEPLPWTPGSTEPPSLRLRLRGARPLAQGLLTQLCV